VVRHAGTVDLVRPQIYGLASVRTYLELAKAEFRRYSTYRAATLAGIFTNSVFGFIRLGVLLV
ncbi:MAG TPA: hypothetical protein VFV02_14920, partial [Acidimicrobiales bacterium]|nr:hypothetical protein [Acidimicrobiales bacterium]